MIAGRYQLEREVGRGGMGAVWLATDTVLGRSVAVKRIGMAPGGSSPDLERAEREARLAARLNHPHVVAVFDLVTDGDERWLVMEYVEGVTLAELVRRDGALTPDEASPLVRQAADALAAAHGAGIVHRDVKPSNILVTPDGQVKLSDFGIARAEADASLTQTGLVTGSPAYLAPEVASGSVATDASDVWSLGATLFHALAGRPPYDMGDNLMGGLYRIVHEEPPRFANAGWLRPLLESTMTRDPADRWSMARVRDFLSAGPTGTTLHPAPTVAAIPDVAGTEVLAPVATPPVAGPVEQTPAPPPEPEATPVHRRRGRGPLVVALLVALLLGAIVWAALTVGDDPAADPDRTAGDSSSSPSQPKSSKTPKPSAKGMEGFISDYLTTAAADPDSAFGMLTPAFQDASGGISGYRGFWDQVEEAALVDITADPAALTVDYSVAYTMTDGSERPPEPVTLALTFEDGVYKISGES